MKENEAYCFGCNQVVPIRTYEVVTLKTGAKAKKSKCPVCRSTVFKVLQKDHEKNKI